MGKREEEGLVGKRAEKGSVRKRVKGVRGTEKRFQLGKERRMGSVGREESCVQLGFPIVRGSRRSSR